MMKDRTYLLLSGTVFGVVAIVHLVRILNGWAFRIGPWDVPVWVSGMGVLVPGVLCVWALTSAARRWAAVDGKAGMRVSIPAGAVRGNGSVGMRAVLRTLAATAMILGVAAVPARGGDGETGPAGQPGRGAFIAAAREVMQAAGTCALITVDGSGQPRARTMDPFPPEDDMTVWLATNPKSRKVREIRNDPRVTLYYFAPDGSGYVTVLGTAALVDDPKQKARRWKKGWESFYPDRGKSYQLIRVTPRRIEVFSMSHGLTGDPVTWAVPSVEFPTDKIAR